MGCRPVPWHGWARRLVGTAETSSFLAWESFFVLWLRSGDIILPNGPRQTQPSHLAGSRQSARQQFRLYEYHTGSSHLEWITEKQQQPDPPKKKIPCSKGGCLLGMIALLQKRDNFRIRTEEIAAPHCLAMESSPPALHGAAALDCTLVGHR